MFADFIGENVAYNEGTLNRLLLKDRNILVRMWEWVKGAIAKLGMSKEERAMRKDLEKLENLLSNALESGTGGRPLEDVEKTERAAEKAHLEDELKKKRRRRRKKRLKLLTTKLLLGIIKHEQEHLLLLNISTYHNM